jgi:NADPH2:quinone reductase
MNAIVIRRFGGPENLELIDLPAPVPGPQQILVKVAASTVNPIDISTRNGALVDSGLMPERERYGIGWDVAGEVAAITSKASRFAVGQAVIGLRDRLLTMPGAHAEYVVLDEDAAAPAPRSVSLQLAATLPLNGLTADRALHLSGVRTGQTLLVTGAGGGVGGFVLELARLRGVRTIAVASPDDRQLVLKLGATEFISRTDDLADVARRLVPGGVDAVIDTAVLGITAHDALRGGGTFVALVRPFAPPPIRGTAVVVQEVLADGARLAELAALVDAGHLTLRVAERFGLADVAAAHERFSRGGLHGGRVLITID